MKRKGKKVEIKQENKERTEVKKKYIIRANKREREKIKKIYVCVYEGRERPEIKFRVRIRVRRKNRT